MKPQKLLRNNRGIALLLTISVTTILVTAALESNRRARFQIVATAAIRDRLTLSQMAASGVHVAMAMLAKDKKESNQDSLAEDWASPAKIAEILPAMPFDEGQLAVNITDEMSKIQINALVQFPDSNQFNEPQRTMLDRFLRHISAAAPEDVKMEDDSEPMAIINSIKDWLDSGDDDAITGLSGAESVYYQGREPPVACRNGPLPDVNELLQIKGITPEIFYDSEAMSGMHRYLTVYGMNPGEGTTFNFPGKININTAERPVILALLPSESAEMADALLEYRQQRQEEKETDAFSNPTWYKGAPGFADVSIDPKLITTTSDVFRIESTATLHDLQLTATAVVERALNDETGKWGCKILSWQTDQAKADSQGGTEEPPSSP
ncbi:MAG: general secretion pathway protein GspK [Desulfobacterales bacterium]|nr:MAG: general secretion pathway protein GspK [Desulfobacterales bacterium]